MGIQTLGVELEFPEIDAKTEKLIDDATRRADDFRAERLDRDDRIPEFESSNLLVAYSVLSEVLRRELNVGLRFCEWGSGMGGVSCMAALLGFEALGLEIEPDLVTEARKFAMSHEIAVTFACGSFKPEGAYSDNVDETTRFTDLGWDPANFDVIYAYPWPAERRVVNMLFERYAPAGALLIAYHGGVTVDLMRKTQCETREVRR